MNKLIIVSIIILTSIIYTSCSNSDTKNTANPIAENKEKQTIDAFGVVKSRDEKNVSIDFLAIIEKIHVRNGYKVKMGDPLITLNISGYETLVKNKEVEINASKDELKILQNTIFAEQNELKRLTADLTKKKEYYYNESDPALIVLQNNLHNAENIYHKGLKDLGDKEYLLKSISIPQSEYDDLKIIVDNQKKELEAAKKGIETFKDAQKREIDGLQSAIDLKLANLDNMNPSSIEGLNRIKIQNAKISNFESSLKVMKDKLNKGFLKNNVIVSDISNGVISDIVNASGDIIGQETTQNKKVLSILNLDTLFVEADVSEDFIKDIKIGTSAIIIPEANKTKEIKGKVVYILNKAVKTGGDTNIKVEISIDEKNDILLPDYNVDVKISKYE